MVFLNVIHSAGRLPCRGRRKPWAKKSIKMVMQREGASSTAVSNALTSMNTKKDQMNHYENQENLEVVPP